MHEYMIFSPTFTLLHPFLAASKLILIQVVILDFYNEYCIFTKGWKKTVVLGMVSNI
jgi:hypothetical protein